MYHSGNSCFCLSHASMSSRERKLTQLTQFGKLFSTLKVTRSGLYLYYMIYKYLVWSMWYYTISLPSYLYGYMIRVDTFRSVNVLLKKLSFAVASQTSAPTAPREPSEVVDSTGWKRCWGPWKSMEIHGNPWKTMETKSYVDICSIIFPSFPGGNPLAKYLEQNAGVMSLIQHDPLAWMQTVRLIRLPGLHRERLHHGARVGARNTFHWLRWGSGSLAIFVTFTTSKRKFGKRINSDSSAFHFRISWRQSWRMQSPATAILGLRPKTSGAVILCRERCTSWKKSVLSFDRKQCRGTWNFWELSGKHHRISRN